MPKPKTKVSNNDFCPVCGKTYPREQRDYHILDHNQSMNKEVLRALENIRQELAGLKATAPQSA